MHRIPLKRASLVGALFFLGLAAAHASDNCQPLQEPEWQSVRQVHDGDSLKLDDGRKIRLIGVNTPEMARDNRPAEPFARDARDYVARLLATSSNRVGLVYGPQRKDRYGRTLAHAFLPDGTNLSQRLLLQGLGSQVAITPNLDYRHCYQQAQQRARDLKRKIWHPGNKLVKDLDKTPRLSGGFQHIRGTVSRVGESKAYIWLNFARKLAIQIARDDLVHFADLPPQTLQGKTIETSGWVYLVKGQPRMRVYHPVVIRIDD